MAPRNALKTLDKARLNLDLFGFVLLLLGLVWRLFGFVWICLAMFGWDVPPLGARFLVLAARQGRISGRDRNRHLRR